MKSEAMTMEKIPKILDCLGLKLSDLDSLDQTELLIIGRLLDAAREYATYQGNNDELESECWTFEPRMQEHFKKFMLR